MAVLAPVLTKVPNYINGQWVESTCFRVAGRSQSGDRGNYRTHAVVERE